MSAVSAYEIFPAIIVSPKPGKIHIYTNTIPCDFRAGVSLLWLLFKTNESIMVCDTLRGATNNKHKKYI